MTVFVTAIYGSPRRNQNSDVLLDKALEAFEESEAVIKKLYASETGIKECTGCESCYKTGRCVINDGMQAVYTLLDQSDIVITATPVYFHTVPAGLKRLIDRCQAIWASKYMVRSSLISRKPRYGYIICTAGAPETEAYFDSTVKVLELFYKCINTSLLGDILVPGVDKIHARERNAVLKQVYDMSGLLIERLKR